MKAVTLAISEVAKNALMAIGPIRKLRASRGRTSCPASSDQLERYAFRLPAACLEHGIEGKRIIEIGPGDHLATGLTFLALGAASYTCLDRFVGPYSSASARNWYRIVAESFQPRFGILWPDHLDWKTFPESCQAVRVETHSVESMQSPPLADIVCSHAVGEHVSDVAAFARLNKLMLAPGGIAIHVVDFSGHVWELDAADPLMFLRIPDWLWSAMGSNRGYPNRVPFEQFTATLQRAGLQVKTAATRPFLHHPEVQEATYILNCLNIDT